MTIFTRSDSGIVNRPMFLDYDYLILIEARDKQDDGPCCELTFWHGVVENYGPVGRYRFQKMGNKLNAIEYALKLDELNQSNYFCCLDRDCDDLDPNYKLPKRSILTTNYSFEADCVFEQSIIAVLGLHLGKISAVNKFSFGDNLSQFMRELRWAIVADVLSLRRGIGFFPRTNRDFIGLFDAADYGKMPKLNRGRCLSRFREIKAQYPGPADVFDGGGFARCYGKVASWWFYRVVVATIHSVDKSYKFAEEMFRRNLAMTTVMAMDDEEFAYSDQYEKQFYAIGVGA